MKVYEFYNSTVTTEGVNDPNIFKAVFMAGAPGSGKTTVANQLFSGTGLKQLNVDRFWQLYKSKEQEEDYEKFWDKYKAQDNLYTEGRLGLLIDGTAKNPAKMNDVKDRLESMGYETAMVFVNTDLETAIKRAQKRASTPGPDMGRKLDTKFIEDAWNRTQKALGNYQSMFGDRFYIIDNSNKSMTSSLDYADRQLRQWLSAPPKNPIAKKWIQQQRQTSTEHTLRDWIDIVQQSQSCSIYESDFDPKPIPKVADLQQSGNPDAEKIADATVKYVTENCQPWLQSIKPNQVVYRGILVQSNQESEDLVFTRAVRSNRLPRNSSDALHEFYNKIIDMAGGVANRSNSAFVAGSYSHAGGYGSLFVVMPVGEFHYTWSPYAEDWFDTFYLDLSLDLLFSQEEFKQEVDLEKKWQQHKEKYPESTDKESYFRGVYRNWYFNKIENYDTDNLDQTYLDGMIKADTGLPEAIESGNEIMISAPKMLYIEAEFYQNHFLPAVHRNR